MLIRSFLRMMPGDMSMMLEVCFYEIHAPPNRLWERCCKMLYYAPPKQNQPFRSQLPAMLHTVQCNNQIGGRVLELIGEVMA
jgi:hypothetical protein